MHKSGFVMGILYNKDRISNEVFSKEAGMETYIGHITEDGGRCQSLQDHLDGVARLAEQFGQAFGCGAEAKLLGENHDDGKFLPAFQSYIRGEKKGRVDHSTLGAKWLWTHAKELKSLAAVGAFCIAGHHCGLMDGGSKADEPGTATLWGRMKKEMPLAGDVMAHLPSSFSLGSRNLSHFGSRPMDIMLLTRMLFSCLVDADFLDTESFMCPDQVKRGQFPSISTLADRFFHELDRRGFLHPTNPLNQKRFEILSTCIEKGKGPAGLYSLTVPTGGGKTLSSMAFALKQAVTHQKERIIYVIPYLSIIDQTAAIFRDFLGEEAVLESHSNVNYDVDEERVPREQATAMQKIKLATENWDAPVIITTSEQFWESLYGNRTSKCRKLHHIVNSVVIFDEAQMLPVDFLKPCLCALQELVAYYGVSAVLCSATQPELGNYMDQKPVEIMENIPALYQFFERVKFHVDGEKNYQEIADDMAQWKQALCVASTKKEAEEIFSRLPPEDSFYLSTNLCPAHRRKVIQTMKQRLAAGEPCRVVSTSIISVGVDIDFPVVYLEYAGLDSLIQGAGRCNREGKRKAADSLAHVFWTEKGKKSPFMNKEKSCTDVVRNTYDAAALPSPQAIAAYFQQWYRSNEGNLDYKEIEKLAKGLQFAEIGRVFHLIADTTKSVFIPYDERAKELLAQLMAGNRSRGLMREAAQYMISVRYMANAPTSDWAKLLQNGQIALFENDSELAYLVHPTDYDEAMGLQIQEESGIGIMW